MQLLDVYFTQSTEDGAAEVLIARSLNPDQDIQIRLKSAFLCVHRKPSVRKSHWTVKFVNTMDHVYLATLFDIQVIHQYFLAERQLHEA